MLLSALEEFSNSLFIFLTEEEKCGRGLLLKKHEHNFQTHGDYSFTNTVQSWQEFLKDHFSTDHGGNYLKCIRKTTDDIIKESKNWSLQVVEAREENDRVYLYFNRTEAFNSAFTEITLNTTQLCKDLLHNKHLLLTDPRSVNATCITALRLKYLSKCIENIYKIGWNFSEDLPLLFLTTKSTSNGPKKSQKVICGAVCNSKTGNKEATLTADDYIRKRQGEMTLIAQHKYGVRVSTDAKWQNFISSLGESAVVFELLQIKPSSTVKVNFDNCSSGSSKGASFVLYNCARLGTILKTYESKVEENVYPPLPPLEEVDFSLLTHEEEWSLVYNYILGLPSALKICATVTETHCEFKPHQVCYILSSLVRQFSQYYRKVRILTEPRKHLLPVMFARMYLLHALNDTLRICLQILDIKSVSQMYCFLIIYIQVPLL